MPGAPRVAPGEEPALSAPDMEEATAAARRAAGALTRPIEAGLEKNFDENALVDGAVGPEFAALLTARQRRAVGDRMLAWFGGPFNGRPAAHPALFLGIRGEGGDAFVSLLVPVASGYLKTTWQERPSGADWLVEDVTLPDLGRSLRSEAIESLGPPPLARRRDRSREARSLAIPRLVGVAGVVVIAMLFARRIRRKERPVLVAAALAPILLFAADGYLAIRRVSSEPIALRIADGPAWRYPFQQFQLAIRGGNRGRARAEAATAISLGAAPEPFHLMLGQLAEEAGDAPEAAAEYARALAPPRPAPAAWAGLARLDGAAGRDAGAIAKWQNYVAVVPADPNALFWIAVAQGRLRDFEAAQATLEKAIALDPSESQLYGLSARLFGAAGNAAAAIGRLREEQKTGSIDRAALAADGNFAPIADDPGWKAFLAEKPPV